MLDTDEEYANLGNSFPFLYSSQSNRYTLINRVFNYKHDMMPFKGSDHIENILIILFCYETLNLIFLHKIV